ncbi:MAG: hypothetical protein IJE72_01220 [Clostridia bacterium]|nr:hypothetical protein [Clostridia bacterium]
MKKFVAAALAVFMFFSFCACTANKKTVLTISGTEIDNEIFTYYLDKVINRPTDYGLTDNPVNKDIKAATIGECKKYLAANTEFANAGLSLSSAEKVEISQTVNDFWIRFENHYKEIGVSKQTLTKIFTSNAYNDALFTETYDKGTANASAEKEIQDYFYNNYISFRTVCAYFTAADGSTPMTQIEKNDLLASFENFVQTSGKDVESFSEAVNNAGFPLSNSILLKKGSDGYPDGFFEKVYAQADNTVQLIVYDECVFAVVKENLKEKGEGVYANYRSSCISDLYSAEANRKTEEYISALTVEEKGGTIDRLIKKMA